jgi:hypothetical protein
MDLRQRVAAMGQPPTYSGLADSLPRRLQACMQELLSANERHHELLIASRGQEGQLQQAQAEVERLTQLLATAEAAVELRLDESARERVASSDLREAYALQQGRLEAMESEVSRLQAELAASGHRGAAQNTEFAQLQQRCEEAERRAEQAQPATRSPNPNPHSNPNPHPNPHPDPNPDPNPHPNPNPNPTPPPGGAARLHRGHGAAARAGPGAAEADAGAHPGG